MSRVRTPILIPLAALILGGDAPLPAQDLPIVVYLVRHAERGEDGTSDPPITAAGHERALLLAAMLRDTGITHIHTTDYARTRSTAAPVAELTGLRPAVYDPRDLSGFAERLRRMPGRHFVVGHSDTTPALVEALGGDAGAPIADPEYDRLYVLTLEGAGASTVLLRFGAPPP
jgi:phosphohistidine phosphatase SixA